MFSHLLSFRLAPRQVAMVVALAVVSMFPVLGFGLWRSGMLQQALWSAVLGRQALWIVGFAAVATPLAVYAGPRAWRGWRGISAIAVVGCALANGVGSSLAAGLIVVCCVIMGQGLLLLGGAGARTSGAAMCASTGLAGIMLLLVGASLVHLPLTLVAVLVPTASLAAPVLWAGLRGALVDMAREMFRREDTPQSWTALRTGVAALVLAALLFYGANAAVPERFYDALTMHLMIPTQALVFGRWNPDPYRFALGYFPIAADHLFGLALVLGGENAVKLLNLLAVGGMLVLLHGLVRPLAGPRIAEATLLLLLSLPIGLLLSSSAMVENMLALQLLAAADAILLLRVSPAAGVAALAVLLPCLAATKLHGVVAVVPCAVLAFSARPKLSRGAWGRLAGIAAVAGVLGGAQYANAWLQTGNPVYPLMNDVFRSPYWPPTAFADLRWMGHLSWRLPYRMTFDSRNYLESDNGAIGVGLFLLVIPGAIATLLAPRRTAVIALIIAGFTILVITVQMQYIRYLWPAFPLLLVVCAHGLGTLAAVPGGRALGIGTAAAAAAIGLYLLPSAAWTLKAADLRAGYDPTVRQSVLVNQVATRLAVEAVNVSDAGRPRVLFGGEPYGAFLRGTPIYAAWYNRPLNAALHGAADPAAVAAVLDPEGVDYVIGNPLSADPIERKVTGYAESRGTRVNLAGYAALWRLAPRSGAAGATGIRGEPPRY